MKDRIFDFFQDMPLPFPWAVAIVGVLAGSGLLVGLGKLVKVTRAARRSQMRYCKPQILNPVIRRI